MFRSRVPKILFGVGCISALLLFFYGRHAHDPGVSESPANHLGQRISRQDAAEWLRIEAEERAAAETIWAPEMLAQECGRTVELFWDRLNRSSDKTTVLADLHFEELYLGNWNETNRHSHNILSLKSTGRGRKLGSSEWPSFIRAFMDSGWSIASVEFRHNRFETNAAGEPHASDYYFASHFTNRLDNRRTTVEGDLTLFWGKKKGSGYAIKAINAERLVVKKREGPLPFVTTLHETIVPDENTTAIDPLILYDLDRDGRLEVILAAKNLVYRQGKDGLFSAEQFCRNRPGNVFIAVLADFDNDGAADFLAQTFDGLFLVKGTEKGAFESVPKLASSATRKMPYGMVMAAGDIDSDGDLDLFIGQYKDPFEGGAVPTPFYDADDGNPSFLLLNNGKGEFRDITEAAGLAARRHRRVYSASIAHLDNDNHPDLVVVSDFAGVDFYQNDGLGRFHEVTSRWVENRFAFGMAHALADLNVDGRADLLMIGMTSPTVERLGHLDLFRPNASFDQQRRSDMTFGNRLFLGNPQPGFSTGELGQSIARSGWSWGCGVLDIDNDGFPDVYIVNGLESNASVRDYESEYWLHDQFVGRSEASYPARLYLQAKFTRTRGADYSYGGYEKNRFFLNENGQRFFEAGHLLGLAWEEDGRNLVADDLDGDGRVDLVFTTYEIWPKKRQTIRILKNVLPTPGKWIGFRFAEQGRGSPVNVRVVLRYNSRNTLGQIVTGDSYSSQRSTTLHFGLGEVSTVDSAEIWWGNGVSSEIKSPDINRYHFIEPPRRADLESQKPALK